MNIIFNKNAEYQIFSCRFLERKKAMNVCTQLVTVNRRYSQRTECKYVLNLYVHHRLNTVVHDSISFQCDCFGCDIVKCAPTQAISR